MHQTFEHSVAKRTASITVPANFETPETIKSGAQFFDDNCSWCHGAPGQPPSVANKGLQPSPPNLLRAGRRNDPAEFFWIVKNGVNMTGMPSFGKSQTDEQIWAVVAFLHGSRGGISADDYAKLVAPAPAPEPEAKPAPTTPP